MYFKKSKTQKLLKSLLYDKIVEQKLRLQKFNVKTANDYNIGQK